jgi:hypothetical protein
MPNAFTAGNENKGRLLAVLISFLSFSVASWPRSAEAQSLRKVRMAFTSKTTKISRGGSPKDKPAPWLMSEMIFVGAGFKPAPTV